MGFDECKNYVLLKVKKYFCEKQKVSTQKSM